VLLIDGLFQVELGSRISLEELPFDASYYLGVRVDDDSEMTPRQPLTSVLYALRAEEANRLQGFEPRDLDQSDHLHDGTNPHGVTAAQAGADDGAELLAHTADGANPHAVTPEQLGAALAQDLEGHAAAADPHHDRYSDVESVAAMGVKTTSNPLNHDRYTDARVLAVTGPHVTSVDGLSGGEIDGDVLITRSLAVEEGVLFNDDTRQVTAVSLPNRLLVAPSGARFTSIQAAIDSIEPSAESPWRIDIAPGTYPEALKLKSWIHLAGSGIRGTVVLLSESAESGVSADGAVDVKLSNLTILDPLGPPTANFGVEARGSNLSFEKARIEGFGQHRIRALEGSTIGLHHSEIDGGFESDSPGILLLESSPVIANSDFDHNVDCGIDVQQDGVLDVSSSRFAGSPRGVCVSGSRARARIVDNRFDLCGVSSQGTTQIIGNEIGDQLFIDGGDLSLEGGSVSITSQSTLKLEGSAGAELSTSAVLDLKGSLININ